LKFDDWRKTEAPYSSPPVILITGFADSHFHLAAAQEGIYALLHKPISMLTLLSVVQRACLYKAYTRTAARPLVGLMVKWVQFPTLP
jgi:FixJ family two-component response regulator